MAKRTPFKPQSQRMVIPDVPPTVTKTNVITAWADTASKLALLGANYFKNKEAKEDVTAGSLAGAQADPLISTQGQSDNWINAANATFQSNIVTKMTSDAGLIFEEFKHDPKALQENLDGLTNGVLSDLNKNAPEFAGLATVNLERVKASYVNRARQLKSERDTENLLNTLNNTVALSSGNAVRAVTNLPAGESLLITAQERATTEQALQKQLDSGLISTKTMDNVLKDFDMQVNTAVVVKGYNEANSVGKGGEYLAKFHGSKNLGLSEEQHAKIQTRLFTELSAHNKIESELEQREDEIRSALWAQNESAVTVQLLEGTLQQSDLIKLVKEDRLDPSIAKSYSNAIKEGVQVDNQQTLLEIQMRGVHNMTEQEIITDPTITLETKRQLIEDRQGIVDDQANWINTQAGREAERLIDIEFGIVSGSLQTLDPESVKLAGRLKTEWYREVENLPVAEREGAVIQIAEKIITKKLLFKAQDSNVRQQQRLDDLDFGSEQELDDAVAAGDERVTGWMGSPKTAEINAYRNRIQRLNRIMERNNKVIEGAKNATAK